MVKLRKIKAKIKKVRHKVGKWDRKLSKAEKVVKPFRTALSIFDRIGHGGDKSEGMKKFEKYEKKYKKGRKIMGKIGKEITGGGEDNNVYHRLEGGDQARISADISNEAYGKAGRRRQSISGYEYQRQDSGKRRAVYHNKDTGHYMVGYRGTVLGKKDLLGDARITAGNLQGSDEVANHKKHMDNHIRKYGNNVSVTGHSKGGSMAALMSADYRLKGHTFNAGTVAGENLNSQQRANQDAGLQRHHIRGDPISVMGKNEAGTTHNYTNFTVNPHGMNNFSE